MTQGVLVATLQKCNRGEQKSGTLLHSIIFRVSFLLIEETDIAKSYVIRKLYFCSFNQVVQEICATIRLGVGCYSTLQLQIIKLFVHFSFLVLSVLLIIHI